MKQLTITFAAALALALSSIAVPAQTPQVKGDADKPMTNCPPGDPQNSQAIEKSAIVPNAEGHDKSAAETVQRDGKSAEVSPNCVQEDNTDKDKKG